jgi:hypothetical protein
LIQAKLSFGTMLGASLQHPDGSLFCEVLGPAGGWYAETRENLLPSDTASAITMAQSYGVSGDVVELDGRNFVVSIAVSMILASQSDSLSIWHSYRKAEA